MYQQMFANMNNLCCEAWGENSDCKNQTMSNNIPAKLCWTSTQRHNKVKEKTKITGESQTWHGSTWKQIPLCVRVIISDDNHLLSTGENSLRRWGWGCLVCLWGVFWVTVFRACAGKKPSDRSWGVDCTCVFKLLLKYLKCSFLKEKSTTCDSAIASHDT